MKVALERFGTLASKGEQDEWNLLKNVDNETRESYNENEEEGRENTVQRCTKFLKAVMMFVHVNSGAIIKKLIAGVNPPYNN